MSVILALVHRTAHPGSGHFIVVVYIELHKMDSSIAACSDRGKNEVGLRPKVRFKIFPANGQDCDYKPCLSGAGL